MERLLAGSLPGTSKTWLIAACLLAAAHLHLRLAHVVAPPSGYGLPGAALPPGGAGRGAGAAAGGRARRRRQRAQRCGVAGHRCTVTCIIAVRLPPSPCVGAPLKRRPAASPRLAGSSAALLLCLGIGLPLDLPTHLLVQILCLLLVLPRLHGCCSEPVSAWARRARRQAAAQRGDCRTAPSNAYAPPPLARSHASAIPTLFPLYPPCSF